MKRKLYIYIWSEARLARHWTLIKRLVFSSIYLKISILSLKHVILLFTSMHHHKDEIRSNYPFASNVMSKKVDCDEEKTSAFIRGCRRRWVELLLLLKRVLWSRLHERLETHPRCLKTGRGHLLLIKVLGSEKKNEEALPWMREVILPNIEAKSTS